ncbi:MAG: peptide chain release factor N(5)-glutamine methyltransferase [Candidatus Saccharimonadales bacterium]
MNSNSWLDQAARQTSRLDAELILANRLGCERVDLHAHPDRELTEIEESDANADLARRVVGEPIAYILGYKEFYGRKFVVNSDVLVPRPETEALVEEILALKPRRVLDVGTGSGAIAVSVALESPNTEVAAVDMSPEALRAAQGNAEALGATSVSFLESDLFAGLKGTHAEPFDVIVANLPYVDRGWDWNSQELAHEPEGALYANDEGLEIIKKLMLEAPKYLSENGHVVLEADASQHDKIKEYAAECGLEVTKVSGLALVLRRH